MPNCRFRAEWRRSLRVGTLVAAMGILSLTVCSPAYAESYGPPRPRGFAASEKGQLDGPILGFENLFGYSSTVMRTKLEDVTARSAQSTFSFLGGGLGSAYALPGLSIDGVVGKVVTLGAALRYASTTSEVSGVSVSVNQFALAGRVGLLFAGERVALWPRIGLAHQSVWGSTAGEDAEAEAPSNDNAYTATAFSLEIPLLVRGTWFGVAVGPAFYVPLSGSTEVSRISQSGQVEKEHVDIFVSSVGLVVSGYVFL